MTLKHAQSNNFQILIEKMKKLHKRAKRERNKQTSWSKRSQTCCSCCWRLLTGMALWFWAFCCKRRRWKKK